MTRTREELLREVAGFILLVFAVLVLLATVSYHPLDPSPFGAGSDRTRNLLGSVGAHTAGTLVTLLGLPALLVPFLLGVMGINWMKGRETTGAGLQAISWTAAITFTGGLFAMTLGRGGYRGGEVEWGGELGRLVALGLRSSIGEVGAALVCLACAVAGVVFGVRGSLAEAASSLASWIAGRRGELAAGRARRKSEREREGLRRELVRRHRDRFPERPEAPIALLKVSGATGFRFRRLPAVEIEPQPVPARGEPEPPAKRAPRRVRSAAVQEVFRFVSDTPAAALPEKTMLTPPGSAAAMDGKQLELMREMVEAKCHEFRVDGKVEEVLPGPVITTFEFRPAAGVKYAQVVALEEDLALGLQVEAVRIERIPGKATVGIEVPNPERQSIVLREIVESPRFVHSASPLTLALGKDIHGRAFVADLARMPHLLIGGFTGSGKSVGINAMIMSILFKATPDVVRFILIDPKMVELGIYERLPHLLTPIISDPREAARALRWAVREMRERYTLLASCKVRNLSQYNALLAEPASRAAAAKGGEATELRPLPLIVVIIDELADLMMTCPAEVEDSIGHLSQMARAVGIHLIFATQRPSVDIITGVIKANFPCRIAYKVRTRFDSRTILDTEGAECLLGMGDMLYLAPGTSRPVRLHGALVREEEILTVLKHLRRLGKPEFDPRVLEEPEPGPLAGGAGGFEDPMYDQAARLVVVSRKASASFIQRKLRLGYARSARLLDMMEQEGLVGPTQGSRGREVLVSPDYFGEMDAGLADDTEGSDD